MITLLSIPAFKGTKINAFKAILVTMSIDALFICFSLFA